MEDHKIKMEKIKKAEETLLCWVESEIGCGKESVAAHIEAFGELVDAAKDLAEMAEKCAKTCYYETVTKAMKESEKGDWDEEEDGPYGYDHWRYSSGRFAPSGKGHRSGYTPYVHSPMANKTGHLEDMGMRMPSDRGVYYDAWQDAKRHYHESGTSEAQAEMDQKMSQNIAQVMEQLREMHRDASPAMQKELKEKVARVMDDMTRIM